MIFVIEHEGEPVGAIKVDEGTPVIMIRRDLAYGQAAGHKDDQAQEAPAA